MKMYIGNLPYSVTEDALREMFVPFGNVDSATVIMDKLSGKPRGFAFVEMPEKSEALAAIQALNGKSINEREIVVNEARPSTNRGGGQKRYQR